MEDPCNAFEARKRCVRYQGGFFNGQFLFPNMLCDPTIFTSEGCLALNC